jgi:hypothetical protein
MTGWRAHIGRYGNAFLPGEPWMRNTFLVLLLLAAALRFWDLPNIPYTHDEISALVRIYPSLYETVQRGVVELDTHPPGVQVFEWVWTRLFGMSEGMVKLPFILMGLAAIFLLYRTALLWTGPAPALLLTALMATLQYSVMYAQIARPYAAGLFTTSLLADQLTRHLAMGSSGRGAGRRYLRGILAAAVLSAYTHHFALLLAALMVLTGFLLIRAEQRRNYLFMCGVGILFYLPNLPIFLRQLSLGGLAEWLAPPDRHWLGDHLMFIAHWSTLFAVVLALVVAGSLYRWVRYGGIPGPTTWFLLFWGLTPLAIGLLYSIYRAPVIQYSVLLFSFPYLLLLLLKGYVQLPRIPTLVLTAVVSLAAVTTLVFERAHYTVFYEQKYEAMLRAGIAAVKEDPGTAVLYDAPDEVLRFYLRQWEVPARDVPYVQLRNTMSIGHLDRRLEGLRGQHMVYGQTNGAPNEQLARIQQHFPFMLERVDLADGQVFRFSDRPAADTVQDRRLIAVATPLHRQGPWDVHGDLPVVDDGTSPPAWWFEGREFGVALTLLTDTVAHHPEDQFEVIAHVRAVPNARQAVVSAQLFAGDSSLFYRDGRLVDLLVQEGPARLIVAARPGDARRRNTPIVLKTYFYNIGGGPVALERMDVWLRRANPVQYGLLGPLGDR